MLSIGSLASILGVNVRPLGAKVPPRALSGQADKRNNNLRVINGGHAVFRLHQLKLLFIVHTVIAICQRPVTSMICSKPIFNLKKI